MRGKESGREAIGYDPKKDDEHPSGGRKLCGGDPGGGVFALPAGLLGTGGMDPSRGCVVYRHQRHLCNRTGGE